MSEEEYRKLYPPSVLPSDIEWWTYDEYEGFIEEQKKTLPNMLGAMGGYYDGQGVLHEEIWTQEKIDEAIRRHEQILEYIKEGGLISKPLNGHEYVDENGIARSESVGFGMKLNDFSGSSYGGVIAFENGDTKDLGPYSTKEEFLAAVKAFCDKQVKSGNMTQLEADKILRQYK
ncbi:MAG: hypothetical protein LBH21_03005 [Gracilibacteraceae bacterium]|jgi:hypothetical protein|nr:hypothetical protein [Gracilibacteraceae bacterium]